VVTARLHALKSKRGKRLYSVIFRGKLLVDRSGDPECDAARALLVQGFIRCSDYIGHFLGLGGVVRSLRGEGTLDGTMRQGV